MCGNYKPRTTSLSLGAITKFIPESAVARLLHQKVPSTTATTYHDYGTNANYQVPTNKTFTIIAVIEKGGSSATRTITIMQSDDLDDETNPVTKLVKFLPINETTELPLVWLPTIEAGKYLNDKVDVVSGAGHVLYLYGYET